MNILTQNKLAYELADSMNDRDSIQVYISFVQKYSEDFLKEDSKQGFSCSGA